MRKNANFANHKCALRCALLINMLKLKQLVSNLYHFAFGEEVRTNGMDADGTIRVADRKSTRLNSSHKHRSRMPSSA